MTKLVLVSVVAGALALSTAQPAQAGHNCNYSQAGRCKVSAAKVPRTDREFKALRARLAKDPFTAAALYVYALIAMHKNPKVGEQLVLLASHESMLKKAGRRNVYKGWGWRSSMQYQMQRMKSPRKRYCFPGFASNAKEVNGKFVVDTNAVEVEIKIQSKYVPQLSSGRAKLWICPINKMCFPLGLRQVYLKQGGKLVKAWKVSNASSAYTGCRTAKKPPRATPDL